MIVATPLATMGLASAVEIVGSTHGLMAEPG
jgi:hypothetical protein